jgi:hypothetical protein
MSAESTPYWVLISVLSSSFPLDQGLALALRQVAFELYQADQTAGLVEHKLACGQVRNLRKEAAIGSITGPVFEAELETERGAGLVRFMLTRQGLNLLTEKSAPSRPAWLN